MATWSGMPATLCQAANLLKSLSSELREKNGFWRRRVRLSLSRRLKELGNGSCTIASQGYSQPPPGQGYNQPPQDQGYQAPPNPGFTPAPPVPAGYGYGQYPAVAVPQGMYLDQASGLMLPEGTELASVGRRIGAYFLAIPLTIVTLGIGYIIWGLIIWGNGQTPALQVLGMRCWRPED